MKNRLKYLSILSLVILAMTSSCTREPIYSNNNNTPAGKVRLEIALNYISDKQTVQTKAAVTDEQEKEIIADRVWVLVFNNDATETSRVLKQAPIKAQVVEKSTIYANLSPESTDSWVYVFANVTDAANTYLQGLPAATTLGAIMNDPAMKLSEATSSGLTNPFPMWGVTANSVATINKGDVVSQNVNLTRAVARIDVVVDPNVLPAKFQIRSVSVVNAAKSGWLFGQDPILAQRLTEVVKYNSAANTDSDNSIISKVYCYENNGMIDIVNKNITRIIVEGSYNGKTSSSFYGVDIAYIPQAGGVVEKYDIERNKIYTITIKKIDKDGYASYDLAENSSSFNSGMVADVTVTDPYSHNIVSNGKQYMGITNTHLLVCPKDNQGAKNVLAATLAYTTESSWPRGTITASAGITFVSSKNNSEYLELGTGTNAVIRDVLINLEQGFTAGTIELRIGNLSQILNITTHRMTSPGGDVIEYFTKGANDGAGVDSETDFVVAEIAEPSSDNSWLKISDDVSALESSSLFDKVTNPLGKLYIHIAGNIAYNTSIPARKAQAFVTSKNDEQRYRVHVEQSFLDVYSDANPIEPYTYAGTFHRWNETAERIIRIKGDQSGFQDSPIDNSGAVVISGTWTASVVHGDFIMLSTNASKETAIQSQDPYGEISQTSWNADKLELSGQFSRGEGRKVVTGEINTATTPNIYFKVGLTSRLSSFDAQPRYGLIAISYQSKTSTTSPSSSVQFIYVRQGEEADYLMRPSDPVLYTESYLKYYNIQTKKYETVGNSSDLIAAKDPMGTRTMARKITPFNLRAIADITTYRTDIPLDQHRFVDYPSKGGDFYHSGSGNVVPRMDSKIATVSKIPSARFWDPTISETCPYGYRRISDNSTYNLDITKPDGKLQLSENRQSLWLFPMNGVNLSNFSNQISGYLADGFFDRRKIEANVDNASNLDFKLYKHCVVKTDASDRDAAYWGYLIYNPYNYASIFIPIAGHYSNNGATTNLPYRTEGTFGGILTTTSQTVTTHWITNVGRINSKTVFDNYQTTSRGDAYSVRCIRDEGDPIVGPVDHGVTITPFDSGNGEELYEARITYTGATLKEQLEAAIGAKITKLNSLRVVCNTGKDLTTADYLYLNTLADASQTLLTSNHSLHHLIIRGAGITTIPAGAITSLNWRSVNIMEAKTIANGAFNLQAGSKLHNLSIGYFASDISVEQGAFIGTIDYKNVNLKIRGKALTQVADGKWCNIIWKTITEYK